MKMLSNGSEHDKNKKMKKKNAWQELKQNGVKRN